MGVASLDCFPAVAMTGGGLAGRWRCERMKVFWFFFSKKNMLSATWLA
jgi:hypothetical protein